MDSNSLPLITEITNGRSKGLDSVPNVKFVKTLHVRLQDDGLRKKWCVAKYIPGHIHMEQLKRFELENLRLHRNEPASVALGLNN